MLRTQEECQDLEPEADGAVSRAVGDEMPGTYINFYMANGSESEKGGIILPPHLHHWKKHLVDTKKNLYGLMAP